MTAQFDMAACILVPLTPIHVGGGEEAKLRPETYRLSSDAIELFAPAQVLSALPDPERRQLVAALARDPLGAMDRVRTKVRDDHVLDRIAAAQESLAELRTALAPADSRSAQRSGEVDAFQRAGEVPLVPGSSIKGALRTAWLAREAATLALSEIPPGVFGDRGGFDTVRGSKAGDALMRRGFGMSSGKNSTDADPFRDVTISDAPLPPQSTRIDPVRSWKRRDGVFGFGSVGQMHWERALSVIDGGAPPLIRLGLGVRASAVREARPQGGRAPARPPESVAALLAALEAHHAPLWQHEVDETFFAGPIGERLRAAMKLFAHLGRGGADPDAALVRVGRGGHAESKSVARFRTVHRPQARRTGGREFAAEGSTRHVVNLGGRPAPFGWALIVREDRWRPPAAWLGAAASVADHRASALASGATASSALLYRAGQRVTVAGDAAEIVSNVRPDDREAMVDFGDGPEPVKLSEIDP